MADNTSNPGRIEQDLDRTRARLGDHLTELQSRLSPGQVLDDAMTYFRGNEGADFGRNLLESVRSNPLPAALTGIGLAWLMASGPRARAAAQSSASMGSGRVRLYSGSQASGQSGYSTLADSVRTAEAGVSRDPGEAEHTYTARLDDARGKAAGLKREAQETAASFSQRIRDALANAQQSALGAVHGVGQQVSGVAGSIGNAAQGATQSAGSLAQRTGSAFGQGGQAVGQAGGNLLATISDSPVLLGALGLAAGALLGAFLPQSDQEEQALGGIAGQARDTARGLAQQAMDGGGQVAQTVLHAGRDSAKAHGLAGGDSAGSLLDAALSGDLASNAKQVAQDVLRASDESVRSQIGGKGQDGKQPT